MITENTILTDPTGNVHHRSPLCWSGIFAGAFVGAGLGFLLHLFGLAIGLSAYSSSADGATVIAIGGILGMLIGVIASMGAAGFVAGYLGRFHYCHCHGGVIHGFVTWSIALLLSAIFVIPLTHYITSYTQGLAPGVAVAKTVVQQASDTTEGVSSPVTNKAQIINKADTPTTQDALSYSSWIIFLLFFVGALSSCIGACYGMGCKHHHEEHHPEIPNGRVE